jgi:hypothetical protein
VWPWYSIFYSPEILPDIYVSGLLFAATHSCLSPEPGDGRHVEKGYVFSPKRAYMTE